MRTVTLAATALLMAQALPAQVKLGDGIQLSGYLTSSWVYASNPDGTRITGRLYDRLHDQFMVNAVRATILKVPDADRLEAGFQADVLLGQNASRIRSAGLVLGDDADLPQAFVSLNVPMKSGGYLRFSAGKRWTMMDVEYVDEILNPNFSHGYAYIYASNFTDAGLSLDAHFSGKTELGLRVINGWDVVEDNNTRKSFMGRLALTPSDRVGLSFLGYLGPEQTGNGQNNRYGGQFVGSVKPMPSTTVYAELDVGREEGLGEAGAAAGWWSAGLWGVFDLAPKAALALRGEYFDDQDGVRTSGVFGFPAATSRQLASATATLNLKTWEHALLRPEVRFEHSNLEDFGGPAGHQTQLTVGLALSYIF